MAASGISEPILFGKATSGLATAPGAEQEAYNRLVDDRRTRRIQPALRQMLLPFGRRQEVLSGKMHDSVGLGSHSHRYWWSRSKI